MLNKVLIVLRHPAVKRFVRGFLAAIGAAALAAGLDFIGVELPNVVKELGWDEALKLAAVIGALLGGDKFVRGWLVKR